jgi:pyruvate dehydrogenase complex dehydrogenase (E1) component
VLSELAAAGDVKPQTVADAIERYELDPEATTELP